VPLLGCVRRKVFPTATTRPSIAQFAPSVQALTSGLFGRNESGRDRGRGGLSSVWIRRFSASVGDREGDKDEDGDRDGEKDSDRERDKNRKKDSNGIEGIVSAACKLLGLVGAARSSEEESEAGTGPGTGSVEVGKE
jgi:hypothetical protein